MYGVGWAFRSGERVGYCDNRERRNDTRRSGRTMSIC